MKEKVWFGGTLAATFGVLAVFAGYIITIDPFFHYHGPLKSLAYTIDNSRYQNDGIVKHFRYDTLITGSSMTSNFKTTECDAIFGGSSVKTPFHGGTLKEINDHLQAAIRANPDLHTVIRCLDESNFAQDKDFVNYEGIPYYLYDKNPFNDTEYIFNKNVFMLSDTVLVDTAEGGQTTSFDEYLRWAEQYEYGKEAVLAFYGRPGPGTYEKKLSDEERETVLGNIRQNVTDTARENPNITFYYYFSPYSICYWDVEVVRPGKLEWYMDLQRTVIEEILSCENIRLFAFDDNTELTCDLDNYKDPSHYSSEINTRILQWMKEGRGRLTEDNYLAYLQRLYEFYGAYDYESIYT